MNDGFPYYALFVARRGMSNLRAISRLLKNTSLFALYRVHIAQRLQKNIALGWSGVFLDCPDSFRIVGTVFGLSGKFLGCPESFWIVQTVSLLAEQFLDGPDSFVTIRTFFLPTQQF